MFEDFNGGEIVVINDRGLLRLDMVSVLRLISTINGWSEELTEEWWLNYTMDQHRLHIYDGMVISAFVYDEAIMEVNPELALEALNEENQ